jgi:hypothetical protein
LNRTVSRFFNEKFLSNTSDYSIGVIQGADNKLGQFLSQGI